MVGLNFADNQEADNFNLTISERLASKQRKKEGLYLQIMNLTTLKFSLNLERRRQQQQQQQQHHHQQQQQHSINHNQPASLPSSLSASTTSLNARPVKQTKKGKNRIRLRYLSNINRNSSLFVSESLQERTNKSAYKFSAYIPCWI